MIQRAYFSVCTMQPRNWFYNPYVLTSVTYVTSCHLTFSFNLSTCYLSPKATKTQGKNTTYHFSRTKVFRVHLHVHHPCLLAAAHLLLTLAFPPGKTQILTGRYIFPQLLGGSAVPFSVSLIISCAVCFFNVSRRQNMSPALFFSPVIHRTGNANSCRHLYQCVAVFKDTSGRWMRGETEEETAIPDINL